MGPPSSEIMLPFSFLLLGYCRDFHRPEAHFRLLYGGDASSHRLGYMPQIWQLGIGGLGILVQGCLTGTLMLLPVHFAAFCIQIRF